MKKAERLSLYVQIILQIKLFTLQLGHLWRLLDKDVAHFYGLCVWIFVVIADLLLMMASCRETNKTPGW